MTTTTKIECGNFCIKGDKFQYYITEGYVNKKGGISNKRVSGYFSSPVQALNDMVNFKVRSTDTTNLEEVIRAIDEALIGAYKSIDDYFKSKE